MVDPPQMARADVLPAFAGPVGVLAEGPVLEEGQLEEVQSMRGDQKCFVSGEGNHPDVHGPGAAQTEEAEDEPEEHRAEADERENEA